MKLDEKRRDLIADCVRRHFNDSDTTLYEAIFLAGCAWQREHDAKICESQTALGPVWREMFAAAIRAQGDDRG